MLDRQQGQQDLHMLLEPAGNAGARRQPAQQFSGYTAARAAQSSDGDLQPDLVLKQVSITYAAQAGVMDLLAGRAAMLATRRAGRIWLEPDQAAGVRQCRAGRELKAFPGKARERSIEHGGGVLVLLLGRTNNLTWISRRHLIPFPLIRDEPKKSQLALAFSIVASPRGVEPLLPP